MFSVLLIQNFKEKRIDAWSDMNVNLGYIYICICSKSFLLLMEIHGGLHHETPVLVTIASISMSLLLSFKLKWSLQ